MINITLFILIFVVSFILSFLIYYHHYDKLARFHKYSLTMDILAWIGSTIVILVAIFYYDIIEKYNYLLWIQIIFAMSVLNIHIARFFIGLKRKNSI